MNTAWGLVYWGQLLGSWDELPPRDGIRNPGWKLEWERYQRSLVTDFLRWQAGLVREYAPPTQWVTQDFHGGTRTAVDSQEISKFLDVAAINPYHETQDRLDGWWIACMGDFTRSMKRAPYLVTETNAQAIGWDAKGQFPPYDGQLRLQAWAHVASGAHMVEYWHWHSLHYGQETYWKGLLGHDLEPNRVYEEAARIGAELRRLGPQLAGMMPRNRVAILHSVDSHHGLQFMPISDTVSYTERRGPAAQGALSAERRGGLRVRRGAGLRRLRRAPRAAALRRDRRAARADRRLREGRGARAADLQERLHERVEHGAMDAGARPAARGRGPLVPGVLDAAGAAPPEGRPVRRRRGRTRSPSGRRCSCPRPRSPWPSTSTRSSASTPP